MNIQLPSLSLLPSHDVVMSSNLCADLQCRGSLHRRVINVVSPIAASLIGQSKVVSDLGSGQTRERSVPQSRQCPESVPRHLRYSPHVSQQDCGGGGQPLDQVQSGYPQLCLPQGPGPRTEGSALHMPQRGVSSNKCLET